MSPAHGGARDLGAGSTIRSQSTAEVSATSAFFFPSQPTMQPPKFATSRRSLELPAALRARLEELACARYPEEACGLLVGRCTGGSAAVTDVREARNLNPAPARGRYELDPADQLAAQDAAEAAGLDLVGVWHSHPDHPPVPSETDRREAWPGWSYVIVSVAGGAPSGLRSWRLEGRAFVEEEVLP